MLLLDVLAAGLLGVTSLRKGRPEAGRGATSFAGVPVYNYPAKADSLAGLGESSATLEQDWIVVLDAAITDGEIDALCKRARDGRCKMTGHPSAGGVPFIEVQGSPEQMGAMLDDVGGLAKYVEPNPRLNLIPDDDFEVDEVASSQSSWHIENIGRPRSDFTGKGVNVYVFDTGIRVTHEDFTGRAVPTLDVVASPSSPIECKGAAGCAGDVRGHGTHCAGTVGGARHGAAPGATIHAVKVLDDGGAGPWSNIIGGLDWLAQNARMPAVASLSLGGLGVEQSVGDAVEVAVRAGITVVLAAGNFNKDACDYTPAFTPYGITVGAIAIGNNVAGFSNYGACTNIWAPGFSIMSNSPDSDTATAKKSGTSMAAPQVAGGAALILEGNPDFTPTKVRAALIENGIRDSIKPYRYGGGQKSGSGDVNLRLWVGTGDPNNQPRPTPSPKPPSRRRFFR